MGSVETRNHFLLLLSREVDMTELTEVTDLHPGHNSYSVSGPAPGENDFP